MSWLSNRLFGPAPPAEAVCDPYGHCPICAIDNPRHDPGGSLADYWRWVAANWEPGTPCHDSGEPAIYMDPATGQPVPQGSVETRPDYST